MRWLGVLTSHRNDAGGFSFVESIGGTVRGPECLEKHVGRQGNIKPRLLADSVGHPKNAVLERNLGNFPNVESTVQATCRHTSPPRSKTAERVIVPIPFVNVPCADSISPQLSMRVATGAETVARGVGANAGRRGMARTHNVALHCEGGTNR